MGKSVTGKPTIHIYTARLQPATRYVAIAGSRTFAVKNSPRKLLRTTCCKRLRIAANCVAQCFYDDERYFCASGKGCNNDKALIKRQFSRLKKLERKRLAIERRIAKLWETLRENPRERH